MNLFKVVLDKACWAEVLKDPSHILTHLAAQQPDLVTELSKPPVEKDPNASEADPADRGNG